MLPEFKSVQEIIDFLEINEASQEEIVGYLKSLPAHTASGKRRGQLAGLTVEEMSDEQLKREIINANSVLYKAKQRGASEDTIARNQARVDSALAEKAKRTPEVVVEETTEVETNEDVAAEL